MSTSPLNQLVLLFVYFQSVVSPVTPYCATGRVFLGNVNVTYPENVRFNGIYVEQPRPTTSGNEYPTYKHESRDQFLYHVTLDHEDGMWMVTASAGSRVGLRGTVGLSAPTFGEDSLTTPDMTSRWRVLDRRSNSWRPPGRAFRAVCVGSDFTTCTSGLLRLTGLANRHERTQSRRTGVYEIMSQTHQLRPVYRHRGHSEYLYYADGLWLVGPEIGQVSGGMFVRDTAWRPEHIVNDWVVFTGSNLEHDTELRVVCQGSNETAVVQPVTGNQTAERETSTSRHLATERELDGPLASDGLCAVERCSGHGRCTETAAGSTYVCHCGTNYFGQNCELLIRCPEPPTRSEALSALTGRSFLDLALYRCHGDAEEGNVAVTGAVCQLDGTWSDIPNCPEPDHSITPEHPDWGRRALRRILGMTD